MIDNEKEYHDWHPSVYFFGQITFIYIYIVYARDYDYSVVVSICRFSKRKSVRICLCL